MRTRTYKTKHTSRHKEETEQTRTRRQPTDQAITARPQKQRGLPNRDATRFSRCIDRCTKLCLRGTDSGRIGPCRAGVALFDPDLADRGPRSRNRGSRPPISRSGISRSEMAIRRSDRGGRSGGSISEVLVKKKRGGGTPI